MTDVRDFEQLVRRHQGAVCAMAFSVLRDRGRSEEIAQEAFLVAWQKLPAMSPPPTMPAWICGIARNLALNAARRKQEVAMDADPISSQTPLQAILDHEATELAARALEALAERDREVVVLYYRGDGSLAGVASALGITEVAARQRLHRGRDRLRTALAAVETTLRATRPGPAFTAACVAALAAGVVPRAEAAPAPRVVPWSAVAAIAACVLAVVGVGVATHHTTASPTTTEPRADDLPTRAPASTNAGPAAPVAPAAPPLRRIDATARAALVESITAARSAHDAATRTVATQPSTPPGRAAADKIYDFAGSALGDLRVVPPPGPLSTKTTIRYAIQLIQPLLLECYTQAAPHLARKDGTIEVTLRLIGEPDVGTIVESVTLGGDAYLAGDAPLAECMRETLMTVELQPMPAPQTWDVVYPFTVGR